MMETEELKSKQAQFLEEIKNQDKLNRSLKEEAMLQKQSCEELESNLTTKNELVRPCFTLPWLYSLEIENSLFLGLKTQLPGRRMGRMWFNGNSVLQSWRVAVGCALRGTAAQKTRAVCDCARSLVVKGLFHGRGAGVTDEAPTR